MTAEFFEKKKKNYPENWGNKPKIGLKQNFFNLLKNLVFNLFHNKSLYYLLCSCTNSIFAKNLVPKIYAEILSANQIARFLN